VTAGQPRKLTQREQERDEQVGGWPRERLVSMDEKFRHTLETAIASGQERL
jgi:hypothetical protein